MKFIAFVILEINVLNPTMYGLKRICFKKMRNFIMFNKCLKQVKIVEQRSAVMPGRKCLVHVSLSTCMCSSCICANSAFKCNGKMVFGFA
jgi:hypothetical protein